METEEAKKTRRKETEKSGSSKKSKEGVKEKRTKDTRKKGNEEAMLEKRAKEEALKNEALDFYRQLRERNLPYFDGASIDFHRKRESVVFIPGENPILSAVKKEELKNFLVTNNVRRVLVDALFPSRVPLLQSLLEHGIEVYALRRPSALSGFKAMMLRRLRKNKRDEDLDNNDKKLTKLLQKKNDFIDAVALAFTWPKFHRWIDLRYIMCWRAMNKWRWAYTIYYKVQQMLSEDKDESPIVTLHEDRLIEKAREFVDTVERYFPDIRRVFEKIKIPDDDVIAQALCAEIVLETYHIERRVSDALRKAGIGRPSKRKKKKQKSFIHDGKLLFALIQLTIRLYHLIPKKDKRKIKWKAAKMLKRIWRYSRELQMTEESGRVGEALGVSAPSRIERVTRIVTRHRAGRPASAGNFGLETVPSKAPDTRPTDHHSVT